MTKVVSFEKEAEKHEPLIWQCNCGNCAFIIYENGLLECSDCGSFQDQNAHFMTVRKWTRKVKE